MQWDLCMVWLWYVTFAHNLVLEYVSLCVRETKQNTPRKCSHRSPLVSITEEEETECQEGLELDAAECTTNSPNCTDKMEVYSIMVHEGEIFSDFTNICKQSIVVEPLLSLK